MNASPGPRKQTTQMSCSRCGKRFLLHQSIVPPFCSERCQLIDLGRWLDESIGLPFEGDPGDSPVEYHGDEDESSSIE